MNLELSSEQRLLAASAEERLGREKTIEAARSALEAGEAPDHWRLSLEAGWTDLLSADAEMRDQFGLLEAMLVLEQCGAVLANPGLLSHLTAKTLVAASGVHDDDESMAERRLAFVPSVRRGSTQASNSRPAVRAARASGIRVHLNGEVHWVLDGTRAQAFILAVELDGEVRAAVIGAGDAGVSVRDVSRYDMTRSLADVRFGGAEGRVLDVGARDVWRACYLQQAMFAAEAVGTASAALKMATAYSKQRYTFGRAIGSYQGVKHRLVEMVRLIENARSLCYRAAWADQCGTIEEVGISAFAARSAADRASLYATDQNLYVHGAIGATWEHDGHLLFRRAQLSRRLLGGFDLATRAVAELMLAAEGSSTPKVAAFGE